MDSLAQTAVNATTNHTYEPADLNLPVDDEDDFKARREAWKRAGSVIKIMYRMNVALAVIFCVCCLILFLIIFNRDVRRKSTLWFLLHIDILAAFLGLGVHVPGYMESLAANKPFCLYIMYAPEYVFTLIAFSLILLNIEMLFRNLLQTKFWQNNQFVRFIISVLLIWLLTAFVVGHITIENNVISRKSRFCFRLAKKAVKARLAVRDWAPAAICFLSSVAVLVIFYIQKAQPRFISAMGNLREMTKPLGENGETLPLMLMTLLMNVIFIVRVILYAFAVTINFRGFKPDQYVRFSVMMLFHTQTMYVLPLPALFVPEVRSALRNSGRWFFRVFIAIYKSGIGEESTTLPVKMGDVKDDA